MPDKEEKRPKKNEALRRDFTDLVNELWSKYQNLEWASLRYDQKVGNIIDALMHDQKLVAATRAALARGGLSGQQYTVEVLSDALLDFLELKSPHVNQPVMVNESKGGQSKDITTGECETTNVEPGTETTSNSDRPWKSREHFTNFMRCVIGRHVADLVIKNLRNVDRNSVPDILRETVHERREELVNSLAMNEATSVHEFLQRLIDEECSLKLRSAGAEPEQVRDKLLKMCFDAESQYGQHPSEFLAAFLNVVESSKGRRKLAIRKPGQVQFSDETNSNNGEAEFDAPQGGNQSRYNKLTPNTLIVVLDTLDSLDQDFSVKDPINHKRVQISKGPNHDPKDKELEDSIAREFPTIYDRIGNRKSLPVQLFVQHYFGRNTLIELAQHFELSEKKVRTKLRLVKNALRDLVGSAFNTLGLPDDEI